MTERHALLCVTCTAMVLAALAKTHAATQADRPPRTCLELLGEMQPGQPEPMRYDAMMALAARGSAAACAIDPLRQATRDDGFQIRAAAVQALGKIGPHAIRALDDLMARWRDAEVDPRDIVAALHGLGPGAIPRLVPYLNAKRAFGEIANGTNGIASPAMATFGSEAVPALTRALRRAKARVAAASALREIGPSAAPAVPALVVAYDAKGSDEWDRGAILSAIFAIGDRACAARPLLERLIVTEPQRLGFAGSGLAPQDYQYKQIQLTLSKLSACLPPTSR
jgi:HEAT repeat protein